MYSSEMAVAPSTFSSTIPLSTNKHLIRWVEKMADLVKPANIHWVDGSDEENEFLCTQMVASGTFTKLNEAVVAGLLLRPLGCKRRCARRGPYVHLFSF